MKSWLMALIAPVLLGAAPVPLIAGAVRDQLGRPVAGATVTAGTARTVSAADGTFVLEASARTVRVDCTYCAPRTVPVGDDGTVVAVMQRYAALERSEPSAEDLAAVPLAHAEQLISLVPFSVLYDFTHALPGPRVSLYGSRTGGLLIDSGVPSYDSAAGSSPFRTVPGFDTASLNVRDIRDAPRYGDLAGGGTFEIDTTGTSGSALLLGGGERTARVSFVQNAFAAGASVFADPFDNARRADARFTARGSQYTTAVNAFDAADTFTDSESGTLSSSMGAVAASLAGPGAEHPYVLLSADRAGYASAPSPATALWSDVSLQGGVHTDGAISLFADAATRFSSGFYSYGTAISSENGNARQTRFDAGAASRTGIVDWQALLAGIDVATTTNGYNGGSAAHGSVLAPSLDANVNLTPNWRVGITAAESVDIPPLLERYYDGAPSGGAAVHVALERAELQFSDLRRLKIGITATREGYSNAAPQNGVGLAASWQISPDVSLRAWTLRYGDIAHGYTPASVWLALRSPGGATADFIWQRDLLDYRPDPHLSASFALPVATGLKIFAATESRSGRRFTTIGLRVQP